jgi:hypothetical protein
MLHLEVSRNSITVEAPTALSKPLLDPGGGFILKMGYQS